MTPALTTVESVKLEIISALRGAPTRPTRLETLEAENAALRAKVAQLEQLAVAGVGLLSVPHSLGLAKAHIEDVRQAIRSGEVPR